jgi:hypothetical protein
MPPPDTYSDEIVARFTVANKVMVRPGETFELKEVVSSVGEALEPPARFALGQNYPNPLRTSAVNPSPRISYSIPVAGRVVLKVYNVLGREIAELVNGHQGAGDYEVTFVAENLPAGVYFYRLQTATFTETRKCILLK